MRNRGLLPASFLLYACSAPMTDTLTTTGCDPLVPDHCGFPFPSDVFLVDDLKTPTGHHVQFGPQTLPKQAHKATDPTPWTGCDGFSPGMAALTHMPGATATGLPNENTLALSVTTQSPTILLNTATGQLMPHIAELDMSATDDSDRAFMIHPVKRLDDNTRYIVAIRHVVDASGVPLEPSPAFAALRDGTSFPDASIDARRSRYADIFQQLSQAGIPKSDLQLAWDYSTASRDNNTRTMLSMRDQALAVVGEAGPAYQITMITDNPNPYVRRRIQGNMNVPLYLTEASPYAQMNVDPATGLPKQNGFAQYPFLVQISNSAAGANPGVPAAPGPILQNGHGLFGSMTEGEDGFLAQLINEKDYNEIAVDLIGFSDTDWQPVVDAISSDIGAFKYVADRQQQGMINQLLAMRMMKGTLWKDPSVLFDSNGNPDPAHGASAIDPTQCYYRGDSEGGIMGTTYMAISTDVTRGLLGEPGMPYDLLLNRSVDFAPYFAVIQAVTGSFMDIQILLGAVQMFWDRSEPDGFAPYVTQNMLPNTPSHNVLLNTAIGDQQVTPLGAHVIARTIGGTQNMEPVNREVWDIPDANPPFGGNGLTEYSFGLPPSPITDIPPALPGSDDPHDLVRELPSSMSQTDTFLRTGMVVNYCGGPCMGMLGM